MKALRIFLLILAVIGLAGIYLIGSYESVFFHENSHQQIYRHYDIGSEVKIDIFDGGKTFPDKPCPNDTCTNFNIWNEIIGYHLLALTDNLWLMIFFCVAYYELRIRRRKGRN